MFHPKHAPYHETLKIAMVPSVSTELTTEQALLCFKGEKGKTLEVLPKATTEPTIRLLHLRGGMGEFRKKYPVE